MTNFIKKKLFDDFFPNFIHVEFEHELELGDLGSIMYDGIGMAFNQAHLLLYVP